MHQTISGGKQIHIGCVRGDLAESLLLPGDPDRVAKIANRWDGARQVSTHREFRSFTGKYAGVPVSALSTGIGPACMAIAVNEAAALGVKTFIRVGSTGSIQKNVKIGDLVIVSAAVRLDCASSCYVMSEYPAVASHEVMLALIEAAESLGICNYHVGVAATTADFYAGQSRPIKASAVRSEDLLPVLQKAGVLSFDMETATLYTLAGLLGLRSVSVCAVFADRCTGSFEMGAGEESAVLVANEAVRILHGWDQLKAKRKKRWFYPSLQKQKNTRADRT